jgi:DNA-binding GntR family transcriptional regulator
MTDEAESLAQLAYRRLEEDIVTLKLKPGEAITEKRLTAELNMGRTPVREALQRLSREGLLTVRPRLGIVVADINPGDFIRVVEARHALEVLLAGASARLAGPEDRRALNACAGQMRAAASAGDIPVFLRLDKEFDEIVSKAACNPFAAKAVAPLQTLSRRFWFRYLGCSDLNASAAAHLELMQAIEAGDEKTAAQKAEDLMQHLRGQAIALISDISWSA